MAVLAVVLVGLSESQAQEPSARIPKHYIWFDLHRSRIAEPSFLEASGIAGAQLMYTWRELEPERDRYDLSAIRRDVAFLEKRGKRLFVQLQYLSFFEDRVNVPDYLLEDPAFGGGAAKKFESPGNGAPPIVDGWVARLWDPAVRERLDRLFGAIAEEFDGRIAGLNLPETAIGFGHSSALFPAGYTYDTYFEGIKAVMSSARRAFRQSDVIVYANFMPGEELPDDDHGYLRGVYAHADAIGMGVGGPDLLPNRWFQRQNSLPLIAHRAPTTAAGMAVQDGNLDDVKRSTGERVTVEELYAYARDELHLDYVFWGTQEPYYSEAVLPFLAGIAKRPR